MAWCVNCNVEGKKVKVYRKTSYCENCYYKQKALKKMTLIPLRDIWYTMVGKCYKPHWGIYKYYGARGYTVCDEWKKSKEAFIQWGLANQFKFGMRLRLKDDSKFYSPETCFLEDRNNDKNESKE